LSECLDVVIIGTAAATGRMCFGEEEAEREELWLDGCLGFEPRVA